MSTHTDTARTGVILSLVLALAGAALTSCRSAGGYGSETVRPVSREVLPMDKIAASYPDVYAAIESLRPEFLTVRDQGPTSLAPVAYLDGVRLADPTMLRLVPVSWVREVRWVRPNQTSPLYLWSNRLGGGIFVTTTSRSGQ